MTISAKPKPYRRTWSGTAMTIALASMFAYAQAAQIVIDGPPGSGYFGRTVTLLPNGNFVVLDTNYDDPVGSQDVGALYLYSSNGALISTLRGQSQGDMSAGGVVLLRNGNFVLGIPSWNGRGAAVWCDATVGCNGFVSASNALVGSTAGDSVGSPSQIFPLSNGNYVVASPGWDNGAVSNAGAATWGSGSAGVVGEVSASNSLVGSSASDNVGNGGVLALGNGNYVVSTPFWDGDNLIDNGALTFGNGDVGIVGPVSLVNSFVSGQSNPGFQPMSAVALANGNYVIRNPGWRSESITGRGAVTFASGTTGLVGSATLGNSLVGTATNEQVGAGLDALANGNYLIRSPNWNGLRGAVTWASGDDGITGTISAANSLIGTTPSDFSQVRVTELAGSNYLVEAQFWDSSSAVNVGAVTFGSGTSGVSGVVSEVNSLVGSIANDLLSSQLSTALSNGNYVVNCPQCDIDGRANTGAATFGSAANPIVGPVNSMNSLVGSSANDLVGDNPVTNTIALSNGNYVVATPSWDDGAVVNVGAVVFGSGLTGISGVVGPSNALIGSTAQDRVGFGGVTVLSNGNYVVRSGNWNNGAATNAGAATFASGETGLIGVVSAGNSLVGGTRDDVVGSGKITALANGNYVVSSYNWDNGATVNAGAATWGSGIAGVTGLVSAANSLVGTHANDQLGSTPFTVDNLAIAQADGNYVLLSPNWDNGNLFNAGAVTLGRGDLAQTGPLNTNNSVLGSVGSPTLPASYAYDPMRRQLIVGLPAENRVVLLGSDLIFADDFE